MRTLSAERCVACRRDSPRVTVAEVAKLRAEVPDWQLLALEGERKQVTVLFADLKGSLELLAERLHEAHPGIRQCH